MIRPEAILATTLSVLAVCQPAIAAQGRTSIQPAASAPSSGEQTSARAQESPTRISRPKPGATGNATQADSPQNDKNQPGLTPLKPQYDSTGTSQAGPKAGSGVSSGAMPPPAPPPSFLNRGRPQAPGVAAPANAPGYAPGYGAASGANAGANPGASAGGTAGHTQPYASTPAKAVQDQYPAIGNLETVTLGQADPASPIEHRLSNLENTVFNKTFQYDSLFDRTERLKKTILGDQGVDPNSAAARDMSNGAAAGRGRTSDWIDNPHPALESVTEVHYLDEQAALPENQQPVSAAELAGYAVALVNHERQTYGLAPLTSDSVAQRLAQDHTMDQAKRSLISHFSSGGDNPDRRLTLLEGTDSVTESIASVKVAEVGTRRVCKAAVARVMKTLLVRQDDRDALLSPDATHIGFASALSADGDKVISTAEIITRRAIITPVPVEVVVGDKIEVKGVLHAPYYFDKITIAWEAYNPDTAFNATADDAEEALPYFPPLDYIAFSNHSEQNHDKAILALKTVGMVAAVAGGLFIPPVALAAPLIAVAGSGGEPKPVSDIPVKGGIKVDGAAFSGHIPLNNSSKDGLYYVTVWANMGRGQKSIAVSRRVILVKASPAAEAEAHDRAAEKARNEQEKLDKENEKAERRLHEKQEKADRKAEKEKARAAHNAAKNQSIDPLPNQASGRKANLDVEGEVEPAGSLPSTSSNSSAAASSSTASTSSSSSSSALKALPALVPSVSPLPASPANQNQGSAK